MQSTKISLTQQIQNITGVSEHLAFIKQISQRFDFGDDYNNKEQLTLAAVQNRLNDENLYITVVGEASTGKSTFINALLGDVLLETNTLMMTTTISTKVIYGNELSIYVKFKEEAAEAAFSYWGLGILGGKREGDTVWRVNSADGKITFKGEETNIRGLITKLTTSDEVAGYIDSIYITYPSDFLKPGIVLIDTPGLNATNEKHKEYTRIAVAQADASIIVTPGTNAITRTLSEALANPVFLRPFLHRCILVLTRMDEALKTMRKVNRQEAIDMVHKDALYRLTIGLNEIGINKVPDFYISSAQSVLEPYTGYVAEDRDLRYWREEFGRLKIELFEYMLRQRAAGISESVLKLIEDLLQHIEVYLSELWEEYDEKKGQLETTVHDLDAFCKEQKKLGGKRVNKTGEDASDIAEMAVIETQNKALEYIKQQVFGSDSLAELKGVTNNVNRYITSFTEEIDEELRIQINRISSDAQKFCVNFDSEFSKYYQRLTLISKNTIKGQSLNVRHSDISGLNFGNLIKDDKPENNFLSGAVTGGAIAAIVFGAPFIIPLAILSGLFALFNQPSLYDSKVKVWSEIEPRLMSFFKELKGKVVKAVNENQNKIEEEVKQYIKEYEKKYSNVVKIMRSNQEKEYSLILQKHKEIENTLKNLQTRRLQIKEQQENLKLNYK